MKREDIESRLEMEMITLNKLRGDYERARSEYLSELERDCERGEGSMAQEARRERHQANLKQAELDAQAALIAQEKLVAELNAQLN